MDKNIRENAEQQLNMLETNEDYGLHLMEITLSENLDFSIRHLASVLLNRYIAKHWCDTADKFEPPEVPDPVKQLIRDYLLKSLAIVIADEDNMPTTIRKLLSSFAHSISNIAQYDWPQHWPQLFPMLNQYLISGSQSAIYSSLKVFKEIAHEITDTQIPDVAPVLLPQLLNIFTSRKFAIRTSTNAIKIFGIISETIMVMNELDKNAIKNHLAEFIPRFTEYSIEILMTPETSDTVDIGMKKEVIFILTKLLRYCRKYMKTYLPKILGLIWQHLTTSAQIYVKFKVNSADGDFNDSLSESVDSDGETIGFESLIYTIIDFVNSTFEFAKYRVLIKPVLSDLLYYLLCYVQMTDEQIEKWQSNLDQLIEEDDIDTSAFSLRIAAQDLIMNLARDMTTLNDKHCKKDDELFKIAFLQAIQRHFSEASELEKTQKARQISPQTWWKIIESCLYVMGILSSTIIYTIKSGKNTANEYKSILDNVLLNLNMTESFMAGRSLWTASRFSQIMNDQSLDNFLRITSTLLNTVEAPILRVYALRATYYFFENVQMNQRVSVIKPHLPQFLQGLISIGMNCNSDTLYLILQIIDLLLELDSEFTATVSSSICSISLSSFLRFPDDAIIFDVVLSILDRLFSTDQCFSEIQKRLLPIIVAILHSNPNDPNVSELISNHKIPPQNMAILQPQALDMLTKMINHSNGLNDFMIQKAYPSMINCINKAFKDSSAIFQSGTECLSAFLKKGSDFIARYVDPTTNQNGIILALNICINLLNPHTSDSAASYVGRVIVILIMKSNQIIGHENIQHLLRSTLVRLNTSKELPIMQSLILVFAHLLYTDLSTILVFLNSLPAPDGTKSALEFVMDKWLGIQRYFHGYENKASTVALCRLFQHALQQQANNNQDSNNSGDMNFINLNQIQVSCDDEFDCDSSQTARTRSQTANQNKNVKKRFVPCTLKILKLLINEMVHIREYKAEQNANDEEYDDDDSDDEIDDEDDQYEDLDSSMKIATAKQGQQMIDLTDLLLTDDGHIEDQDDDEILSEEIGNLDLENVLQTFLSEFRHLPMARDFIVHLTPTESDLLGQL